MSLSNNPWLRISGGERASAHIQESLDRLLPECFGYYGISLGEKARQFCYELSPIRRWFNLCETRDRAGHRQSMDCITNFSALPLESDSVDLVFAPHILEFMEQPHLVLREIERIIIPDGKVILSGINPWSLYGARFLSRRLTRRECRESQLIGLARLKDWLMLMGFSLEFVCGIDARESEVSNNTLARWWASASSHFHSHYLIMAKKNVATLTPMRPNWRAKKNLVPSRLAEPGIRKIVDQELRKLRQ